MLTFAMGPWPRNHMRHDPHKRPWRSWLQDEDRTTRDAKPACARRRDSSPNAARRPRPLRVSATRPAASPYALAVRGAWMSSSEPASGCRTSSASRGPHAGIGNFASLDLNICLHMFCECFAENCGDLQRPTFSLQNGQQVLRRFAEQNARRKISESCLVKFPT